MPYVQRYDRGELLQPTVRDDGTLLVAGRAARPGILTYRTADGGTRRELVEAEDLHKADSLGTLGRAAVTLEHPDEEVTPDNVGDFGVGDVDGEVFVEEDGFVTVRMAVRRRDAIDAIRAGKQELSPGYRVRIEETSGVHPVFGRYDAIQRDRRYNHLAIVDRARGGASVRLRTDGAAYEVDAPPPEVKMNPLLIALLATLGVPRTDSEDADLTVAKTKLDGILSAKVDLSDLQTQMDTLQANFDTMKGERDALQTKVDQFNAKVKADADAEERKTLDGFRESLKLDSVGDEDNDTLRRRIALHFDAETPEDASAEYLNGAIRIGMRATQKRSDAWVGLRLADPQPPEKRDDADAPKSPTQIQNEQADAAFKAGRGGK